VTWIIRRSPPGRGRQHVLDAANTCTVCGTVATAIAAQPGDKVCDGGAALRRKAADMAITRAVARSR